MFLENLLIDFSKKAAPQNVIENFMSHHLLFCRLPFYERNCIHFFAQVLTWEVTLFST